MKTTLFARLMLGLLALAFALMVFSACQTNRPVLRAIADLRTHVVRLDSTYNAFQLTYSRHEQAEIDSTVRRYSDDDLRREIRRITDPTRQY